MRQIQTEVLQSSIKYSTENTHSWMIMEGYSCKRRKDKNPNTVLILDLGNMNITYTRDGSSILVLGIDLVMNGADINPVCTYE